MRSHVALTAILGCSSPASAPMDAGDDAPAPAPTDGALPPDSATEARFHVRSQAATRIELWLYAEPEGAPEVARHELVREAGADWSVVLPVAELPAPTYYGYRAWGPNWPYDPAWTPGSEAGFVTDVDGDGNRFNPNKLLVDPWAREISHDPIHGSIYAGNADHRAEDSAPVAPESIRIDGVPIDPGPRPMRPFKDEIIYEVHPRGFTQADPEAPDGCAGTYRAAAARASTLAALGVTAIELLPVHETPNEQNDLEEGTSGDNYWGYSTLAFFAPDRRYACDRTPGGPTREFRAMVRAFHEAGLKVYLDVVYNHTAEGGGSRILSLKGLDNASYYEISADGRGYQDNTATGANLNAANELARELVLASLHYWVEEMGVDGFRFDLAPVLGNRCPRACYDYDRTDPGSILARARSELPGVDLVAEPWAIGPGTYQIGNLPAGWAEWNDHFRDLVRKDQNRHGQETVTTGWLANRLSGSIDLFGDDGRRPWHSVNYVASHDGFALRDVYACNLKQNDQPWPYGPSSGGDDHNWSWDQDGDAARQRQATRTGMALTLVAAGVPMVNGGDELYRTQYCNNNPYNLDSEKNWLDWTAGPPEHRTFVERLFQFRRAHPALRPDTWRDGTDHDGNGFPDIAWFRNDGTPADAAYLDDPEVDFLAFAVDGAEYGDEATRILVLYFGEPSTLEVTLPPGTWWRVADTAAWMEPEGNFVPPGDEALIAAGVYELRSRSLAIFMER